MGGVRLSSSFCDCAAINSLTQLQKKLGQYVTHDVKVPTHALTQQQVHALQQTGCLPHTAASNRSSSSSSRKAPRKVRSSSSSADSSAATDDEGMGGEGRVHNGEERVMHEDGEEMEEGSEMAEVPRHGTLEFALQSLRDGVEGVSRLRGGTDTMSTTVRATKMRDETAGRKKKDATKLSSRNLSTDTHTKSSAESSAKDKTQSDRKHSRKSATTSAAKSATESVSKSKTGGKTVEGKKKPGDAGTNDKEPPGIPLGGGVTKVKNMIFRRKCIVTKSGKEYCFATDVEGAGGGRQNDFFIKRKVMEKSRIRGLWGGDVVLVSGYLQDGNVSNLATAVTLVLRNNTKYLEKFLNTSTTVGVGKGGGGVGKLRQGGEIRQRYECNITSTGSVFSFADNDIFISNQVRDACRIKGLWVGDVVRVEAIYNCIKGSWTASSVRLVRRNNPGKL